MSTASRRLRFSRKELLDLGIAWIMLTIAFVIFLARPDRLIATPTLAIEYGILSAVTVGSGFLLHELAHKVVAIRFGQLAEFRADYGMLVIAILSALVGIIFAAPGAVHHRGRVTERELGLISVAGPVTNLGLFVVFLPLALLGGFPGTVGAFGLLINAFLAAFNMIPYGPLDGKTVLRWSKPVFGVVFLIGIVLTIGTFLFVPVGI